MRAAVAQFGASDDKKMNLCVIEHLAWCAAEGGADMLFLPEYAMFRAESDRTAQNTQAAEPLDGEFVSALSEAAQGQGLWICAGMYEKTDGLPYNTTVILDDNGELRGAYRKTRLYDAFGYRESVFKHALRGRVVITAVTFRLSRRPRPDLGYGDLLRETEARGGATLRNIREAVCAIRRSKLPDTAVLGNAGSFFKNPVVEAAVAERLRTDYPALPLYPAAEGRMKLAAGWLIEQAGMKGHREGCVGVHDRQALVLVNYGDATGGEVLALAHKVQEAVRAKFGVEIAAEVNVL